jgi:hypothetical protein
LDGHWRAFDRLALNKLRAETKALDQWLTKIARLYETTRGRAFVKSLSHHALKNALSR